MQSQSTLSGFIDNSTISLVVHGYAFEYGKLDLASTQKYPLRNNKNYHKPC